MEAGSVVFAKTVKQRAKDFHFVQTAKRGRELIAVVIGSYDIKKPLPTMEETVALMGSIGYFPGDLLVDVFGEEGFQKMAKEFKKRYDK